MTDREMDDRTLLELAAKAAGLTNLSYCLAWKCMAEPDIDRQGGYFKWETYWNPLKYDSHALQLVVILGIDLEWRADGRVAAYRHANANGYCFTAFESSRENREENTRRAIVRAAAEIGRRMIEEEK